MGSEDLDLATIRCHRDNHHATIKIATQPVRDSLWQSTFDGKLIKHSDIKRIRKQYSFYTVDEVLNHQNRFNIKLSTRRNALKGA
jgi:hypothetical protein